MHEKRAFQFRSPRIFAPLSTAGDAQPHGSHKFTPLSTSRKHGTTGLGLEFKVGWMHACDPMRCASGIVTRGICVRTPYFFSEGTLDKIGHQLQLVPFEKSLKNRCFTIKSAPDKVLGIC